jgi:hypothetical protein
MPPNVKMIETNNLKKVKDMELIEQNPKILAIFKNSFGSQGLNKTYKRGPKESQCH